MTNYLLSLDTGISTGVSLLSYTQDTVPVLEGAWQFSEGITGLLRWLRKDYVSYDLPINPTLEEWTAAIDDPDWAYPVVTVIAEKFTARATKGFNYRTDSLESLRCEGALIALGLMPDYSPKEKRWRDPSLQYLVGGKGAEAKKRQHRFLKESGYYRTGKDFGTPDADDARSAIAHGLAYLAREGHTPTFGLISDWVERNPV